MNIFMGILNLFIARAEKAKFIVQSSKFIETTSSALMDIF